MVAVSLVHNPEKECKEALQDDDLMEVDVEAAVVRLVVENTVAEEVEVVDVVVQQEQAVAAGWEELDIVDLELLEFGQEVESKEGLVEGQKEPDSEGIGLDAEQEVVDSAGEELEEE